MDSTMLSCLCPFEDQCFPFSSLNLVIISAVMKASESCYAMQIICLLSSLKQTTTTYETKYS